MSITLLGEDQQENPENKSENEKDEDDTGEENDSDDSDDEDEDEDEDAEAIARRLGDQLWADIQRARAGAAAPPALTAPTIRRKTRKEEAAFATMKTVLAYAASDPLVHSTLSGTAAPGFVDSNMLDVLSKIMAEGRITKQAAGPLSQVLVKLAQSELLFSPLPTLPMPLHKRKRDEGDSSTPPPAKRTAAPEKTLEDATPAEPPQAEAGARLDETREELEEKVNGEGVGEEGSNVGEVDELDRHE